MKNEKITSTFFSKSKISNTRKFCYDKIAFFKRMITRTILSMQQYKSKDILSASDLNIGIQNLELIHSNLHKNELTLKKNNKVDFDAMISDLQ